MSRVLALALLTTACSDQGFQVVPVGSSGGDPEVVVWPDSLDFGSLGAIETDTLSFQIRNTGEAILDIDEVELIGDAGFTVLTEVDSVPLEIDESISVDVAFSPLEDSLQEGEILVYTNDPDRPAVPVDLLGWGRVPMLQITPDPHDFGTVNAGCPDEAILALQNIGAEELVIAALDYTADAGLSLDHALDLPLTLEPGAYEEVSIHLLSTTAGEMKGTLAVDSTDPRGLIEATQTAAGTDADSAEDTGVAEVDPPVDILFAVDRSCSMDDDAAALADNFGTFVDALETTTGGWQVGVVTLDEGCVNGGVLDADTSDLEDTFLDAVLTGEDEEIVNDEALLQLAWRALQRTEEGDCNEGLLRPGAPFHLIVVSDEPERSTEIASAWTWDHWVDQLGSFLDSPEQLVISGVVDTEDCNEGDDGYAEAIAATGGTALSICSDDWADHVSELAEVSVTDAWTLPLSQEPVVESLAVTVDGSLTTAWAYDSASNAVTIGGLAGGETLSATYTIATGCN